MINDKIKIAIVGGDRRYLYLSDIIAGMGYEVCHLFIPSADAINLHVKTGNYRKLLPQYGGIVLPTPVSRDGIHLNTPLWMDDITMTEFFKYIAKGSIVVGGFVTPYAAAAGSGCGIDIIDLLEIEELAVRNALPTAEGAVQIAMEETPCTIFGSNCIITGYGRISRLLGRMLRGLGANVTVTSRKGDHRAWIVSEGYTSSPTDKIGELAHTGDIFFNTVPAPIFTKEVLAQMRPGSLIIDLASMPGGADGRVGGGKLHAVHLAVVLASTALRQLGSSRLDAPDTS